MEEDEQGRTKGREGEGEGPGAIFSAGARLVASSQTAQGRRVFWASTREERK